MDPTTIITTIAGILKTLVDVGPTVITTVEDAVPFAEKLIATLQGKEVTEADLATLEAEIDALSDKLQAPIPDETD